MAKLTTTQHNEYIQSGKKLSRDIEEVSKESLPLLNIEVGNPYSLLMIYSDSLNDVEALRIATQNRSRALVQVKGLEGSPEAKRWETYLSGLWVLEKQAVNELEKAMKEHPLYDYINDTVGLGLKQTGRLLAVTGDPGERDNIQKLWAYCGYHVIHDVDTDTGKDIPGTGRAPALMKGQQGNWNPKARTRARLIAESCIKQMHSPFRPVYEMGRRKYEKVLDKDGKPLSDLHKHNRSLRLVSKKILLELWIEAKTIRGEKEDIDRYYKERKEFFESRKIA